MKKLVLLGDSIRILGYGKMLPAELGEEWEVWQPENNCRFSKDLMRVVFDNQDKIKGADVIHFNAGLWDLSHLFFDEPFTPLDEYLKNITTIAKALKTMAPRVIFATTTPVRDDNPQNNNRDCERYNAAVVPVLRELGVEINDMYPVIYADFMANTNDDRIHLSDKGNAIATRLVKEAVTKTV